LQSIIETQQAANDELPSADEEIQSGNQEEWYLRLHAQQAA